MQQDVTITPMTRELAHQFYNGYEYDPMAVPRGVSYTPYVYSQQSVDVYLAKQKELNHLLFAVMLNDVAIGEIKLYNIRSKKPECSLSITLKEDSCKELGYGTKAVLLMIQYVKAQLKIEIIHARVTLYNRRAQHVARKIGFVEDYRDSECIYYDLDLCHEFVRKPIRITKMDLSLRREYYRPIALANTKKDATEEDLDWVDHMHRLQVAIGQLIFAIMIDDKPIGEIRIVMISDERSDCMIDMGIGFKEYRNRGYGTEALQRTLKFIKEKLKLGRVRVEIDKSDAKSRHICEKVGFVKSLDNWDKFIYEIKL